MSTDQSPERSNHASEALASVGRLLSQIAAFAVAASSISVLTGWLQASAYYSAIGAPWATSLMSTTDFMRQSWSLMSAVFLSGFTCIQMLMAGTATAKGLKRFCVWTLFIGIALFVPGILPDSWFKPSLVRACSMLAGFAYGIAAGTTLAELVGSLAESSLRWNGYHLSLISFTLTFGLWSAPNYVGRAQADLDGDYRTSSLSMLSLTEDSVSGPDWRLVSMLQGQMLVMTLEPLRENRTFKLVPPSGLMTIYGRASGG